MRGQAAADDCGGGGPHDAARGVAAARGRRLRRCSPRLAFLQDPGLIVARHEDRPRGRIRPAGWPGRCTCGTRPATFGQLQNQAYGYLWPMGPFFAAGSALGLPPWVIQRLWWALLCAWRSPASSRSPGGWASARRRPGSSPASRSRCRRGCSPSSGRSRSRRGRARVAPWVLVPLVGLRDGGSACAARWPLSALVVACAGGVNATAVFAVVPLAAALAG